MKDRDRYFRTTSLTLATFLYVKDQQIAGIDCVSDSTKKSFAFVLSDRLAELVDKYKFGERNDADLLVPVHKYEQARNELLDRLNE
ncbi:MAG: hypothetical protein A3A27_02435 [Candidatus Wildermuthbacteria bacterium RIFCSPLOWO2_01_FULL_47_18]|uniref:DUF5659 domain-containing protein n=1 Tax=Candidatus Wildermuthbacteria bacterium RIFCSPLOWO2_01_FULL_47_18 TaxID=1802460 RepID=A0A1G2RKZ1_9BACT|nr:MAG: hypothetical protein A3A27_02435 [Candidatus Wildermuthbacteria bacterium RIFCSPLOWO2_01_FULL_47_18]